MSPKPPLIPSKNALRFLRQLTLSNSAIVFAGVGSACGIASLNYETRKRVRLAEQIVHNKQVIRSISNGTGASHVARMFEAAERGEDTTFAQTGAHKRRRVRETSTVDIEREHTEQESTESGQMQPFKIRQSFGRVLAGPPQVIYNLHKLRFVATSAEDSSSDKPQTTMKKWVLEDANLRKDFAFKRLVKKSTKDPVWREARVKYATLKRMGFSAPYPRWVYIWTGLMEKHMASGGELGRVLTELLFNDFFRRTKLSVSPPPARQLARHLLSSEETSARAFPILFPLPCATGPARQSPYFTAVKYLQEFCWHNHDPNEQVQEVLKVMSVASENGVPVSEELIHPVVRSLCGMGHSDLAETLIRDAIASSGVEVNFYIWTPLAIGFAGEGAWYHVRRIIGELSSAGVCRTQPTGFALLFTRVFEHYLLQHTLPQAYEFLIYAVQQWGMVPTAQVSAIFISACLKDGRYNLIQEWIKSVPASFARVNLGLATPKTVWKIGKTWEEMEASCEDIYNGVHVMAHGALHDPFSPRFRGVVREAVTRDIRKRLTAAYAILDQDQVGNDENRPVARLNLMELFQDANRLLSKYDLESGLSNEIHASLDDLKHQLRAATALNNILGGERTIRKFSPETFVESKSTRRRRDFKIIHVPGTSEELLRISPSAGLPPRTELWRILGRYYSQQRKQNLPISHDILKYVVPRLDLFQREHEAVRLLDEIYESSYVRGPEGSPFDVDIFSSWLELAVGMKSLRLTKRVLWAILDSGRHVTMSTQILLLIMICYRYWHRPELPWHFTSQADTAENRYLFWRLRRLRRLQAGPDPGPRFKEYETWQQQMRSTSDVIFDPESM